MTLAQKQRLKLVVIIFIFVMLLFTWCDFDTTIRYKGLAKECTEPCQATIAWFNYQSRSSFGVYVFEYQIEGQLYEHGEILRRKAFDSEHSKSGTQVNILYNPQNPNIFVVSDESAKEIYPPLTKLITMQSFLLVVFIIITAIITFPFVKGNKAKDEYINLENNKHKKREPYNDNENGAIK